MAVAGPDLGGGLEGQEATFLDGFGRNSLVDWLTE